MARLLIFLLAGVFLYVLVRNEWRKRQADSDERVKAKMEKQKAAGELAKDPVCGVYVETSGSLSVKDGDTRWHFCSHECRDAFLNHPDRRERAIQATEDERD